ncbi:MAG: hypothetical protein HOQ09_00370, partial [Gemmatimonadaceae bacterium]|nr:hypothetical protein [Gemmatimonadaceae bacterium]
RAMDAVLAIAVPIALTLGVGASLIIRIAFGQSFAPSVTSLRLLAPAFVLTYVTMLQASVLVRIGRGWVLTAIVVATMLLSPLLNLALIPLGLSTFGTGGAGIGASIAQLLTEFFSVAAMTWVLRGHVLDRTTLVHFGKMVVAAMVVIAAHVAMLPLHGWRYPIDVLLYVSIVVGWGAVDVRAWAEVIRRALRREPLS